MRQGKIVLLPVIIIAVLMLTGLVVGLIGCNSKTQETESIFVDMSMKRLSDMNVKASLDGIYRLSEVKEFGYTGSAEISVNKKDIDSVRFTAELLDEDNEDAVTVVTNFVNAYSSKLGLAIDDSPILVPFTSEDVHEIDTDDVYASLLNGYVLFEYSYRDKDGVLWLAHIYSPKDGSLCGSVVKQLNEDPYIDFVPKIDMSKEGESE